MADKYRSFSELRTHEREGTDFQIVLLNRGPTLVLAPHGGGIEPGTSEIAREVAADDISLYLFEGLKRTGNADLHITSHRFDEPQCIALVERAESAVAIHGCIDRPGASSVVFVGGLNGDLRDSLVEALSLADFPAELDSQLAGEHESNICNKSRRGGAQLEIAEGARSEMFGSLGRAGRIEKRDPFWRFCEVVSTVVSM